MVARSKLSSIESKISEALINNEISHEDFTAIINKEKNYRTLKESVRMMKTQRNDTEKNNLIEEGKRKGIDKIVRQNTYHIFSNKCRFSNKGCPFGHPH